MSEFFTVETSETNATERAPMLRQREVELVEMIRALESVQQSEYWKLLKEKFFIKRFAQLQRRLRSESDSTEIYRLQGKLQEAETVTNLEVLAQNLRKELEGVQNQLK